MKKTWTYFYSSKQFQVMKDNHVLDFYGQEIPWSGPNFIHGIEYTEVQEGENPKSNWEDARIVFTETFELT